MTLVRFEPRGAAAWVTLDRPRRRNALSLAMIADIDAALDRALADDTARAVVLTGAGEAFCAGADLQDGDRLMTAGEGSRHPFAALLQKIQRAPKPVIAAVNGTTFGGGLGLVAAADVAFAVQQARFSFSEVRLGLLPAMISVVVLPKIGPHQARRLFLTGRRFDAAEALSYGLLHRVVADGELESAVAEEVADLARGGPRALAEAKRLIAELPGLPDDQAFDRAARWLAELARSPEGREGLAAFVEKRPPSWCR